MSAWRPLLRVARRDALRHKARSLLIVAMVGLPVAAMSASVVLGRTAARTLEQEVSAEMGQADLQVDDNGVVAAEWQALLPEGSRSILVRDPYRAVAIVSGDELFEPLAFMGDLSDPLVAGMANIVEGRAARGPDEVVVSPPLADDLGLAVGDRLDLARPDRTVTVVGTAIRPYDVRMASVFAPPGWLGAPTTDSEDVWDSRQWLVDVGPADPALVKRIMATPSRTSPVPPPLPVMVPDGGRLGGGHAPSVQVSTRADRRGWRSEVPNQGVSTTFVMGVLALVWTGAVSAAAFAVGARRRLREVGLVAASGGAPGHLRRLLVADGVVLGLVGAASGVVAGSTAAALLRPHLDRLVGYAVADLRIPVALVIGAAAVGWVAAVVASLGPAGSAARTPVLAALAGLRPGRARHRSWLGVGALALLAGVTLAWRGAAGGSDPSVTTGVGLVVAGVAACTSPLLGLLARLAGRAPLALRLAARDAGRSRSRAGPATVAAMLGLAAAVGGSTMFESNEVQADDAGVSGRAGDQMRVVWDGTTSPGPAQVDAGLRAALDAVPGAIGGQLDVLGEPGGWPVFAGPPETLESGPRFSSSGGPEPGRTVAVGDLAALDALGGSEASAALVGGSVVALNGGTIDAGGTVMLRQAVDGRVEDLATLPAQEVAGDPGFGLPNYLISAETAESLGLATQPSALVLRASQPVGEAGVRRLNLALVEAVPEVAWRTDRESDPGASAAVVPVMLGVGTLVALFVVGLVTALSREEFRPHLVTLATAGAAPRTRRRLAAAQSGLVAGLAAVLALPAGLIPAVTLLRANPVGAANSARFSAAGAGGPAVVVPWMSILVLVVLVTVLAAAGGGLLTRTRAPFKPSAGG